ncbi:MAG: tRNA pseudouridine(38-40) synthase TruA [Chloroflexi bacterium]|nr:tRNA pseudouridine(38-40) synthase TruA [Chloroflexota bacterium]
MEPGDGSEHRWALVVEYDGTEYHGFQAQPGLPTVQGVLKEVVARVTGERVHLAASGRTDAGVHAKGQVVAFDSHSHLSSSGMTRALNFYLPGDVAVVEAFVVRAGFDPRREARSRHYRYTILNRKSRSPLGKRQSYHVPQPLNVDAMALAAGILEGEHDFAPFASPLKTEASTRRTVLRANVLRKGEMVLFDMEANAFLPLQVRRTVGALVKVGQGKMEVGDFQRMAESGRPGMAGPTAPAQGLCLMKVSYDRPLGELRIEDF